eukprot:COSAG06_NODE_49806_length_323_cov_0.602679_1_plen_64_part_10
MPSFLARQARDKHRGKHTQKTAVGAVSQDGAESGTPCANESHAHHHGLNDSIWEQYKVRKTRFR